MTTLLVGDLDARNIDSVILLTFPGGAQFCGKLAAWADNPDEDRRELLFYGSDGESLPLPREMEVDIFLPSEAKYMMHVSNHTDDLVEAIGDLHDLYEERTRPTQVDLHVGTLN